MLPRIPRRHHRRSIRLPGWDYRWPAAYFVTICTYQHQWLFADLEWHAIAAAVWQEIPAHVARVVLDEWVIMPNHLHGVLVLSDDGETWPMPIDVRWGGLAAPNESRPFANAPSGSLGAVVRSYKAAVTRRINERCHTLGHKRWQRGYYEHIVRDYGELERIRVYIGQNPVRWTEDRDSLDALVARMTFHP